VDKLKNLRQYAVGIFNDVQQTIGYLLGIYYILDNPNLIQEGRISAENFTLDGLDFQPKQALGLELPDGRNSSNDKELLIAQMKRMLLCDSVDFSADFLTRAARLNIDGVDPYNFKCDLSVKPACLWSKGKGKAGSLLADEERAFFQNVLAPIRNLTRHNNGILPPKTKIEFRTKLYEININIKLIWGANLDNRIRVPLLEAFKLFSITRKVVDNAIMKLIKD
jgi:hypothetical protein